MSEATRYLPSQKVVLYPEVPWKNISGFRNMLVHDYLGHIESKTVLNIIHEHVQVLKNVVLDMMQHGFDEEYENTEKD